MTHVQDAAAGGLLLLLLPLLLLRWDLIMSGAGLYQGNRARFGLWVVPGVGLFQGKHMSRGE